MNPLHTEFVRLYHADPQHALLHDATRSALLGADGHVRCAVLELARPADWSMLGAVWRAVQTELELPAPGIAINGQDGYQLWFAWQQGISTETAHMFLQNLVQHYLPEVAPQRLRCWPGASSEATAKEGPFPASVPALHPHSGQWSAFIAPDLAAVFADEPWLDRDPGVEAQAQLLGRLEGMHQQVFAMAHALLQRAPTVSALVSSPKPATEAQSTDYPTDSPTAFLQAVMKDPAAPLALRVQAATALMPPTAS
ncbi:MAG: hypothetical protein E6Q78_04425 [Rhodoferax sp.]|nr:MAG: hypothetical protein E6Q78_04425 [Rhodoferax sp.]